MYGAPRGSRAGRSRREKPSIRGAMTRARVHILRKLFLPLVVFVAVLVPREARGGTLPCYYEGGDEFRENFGPYECFASCGALELKKGDWCEPNPTPYTYPVCCGHSDGDCCRPNAGAISGVVVGAIVFITTLVVGICYCSRCGCFLYRQRPVLPQVVYVQQAPAPQSQQVA